jgi:hypothetical protein
MSLKFSVVALEKIHLNPRTVISAFIIKSIQVMFPEKTFRIENGTIAVKAVYQDDVKLTTPLYLLLSITYFFKVDKATKSVIDSYYLTKGKKERIDSEK